MATKRRDYVFTFNLPKNDNVLGIEIDEIQIAKSIYNKLSEFFSDEKLFKFVIFQLERGEENERLHFQGYFYFHNPRLFSSTKKLLVNNGFQSMHIEERYKNSSIENAVDYCRKEETRFISSELPDGLIFTFGSLPSLEDETQGKRSDLEFFIDRINSGATYDELLDEFPNYMIRYEKLYDRLNKKRLEKIYHNKVRKMKNELYYLSLDHDSVLTEIYIQYGFNNVYRLPSYNRFAFDDYNNQEVIVLDNYSTQFDDGFLSKLLSGFPLYLGARYDNKVACFNKVIIITSLDYISFSNLNHIIDCNKCFKVIKEGGLL